MSPDEINARADRVRQIAGLLALLAVFAPIAFFGWVIWHAGALQ